MNNEIVLLLEALLSLGIAIFFVYLSKYRYCENKRYASKYENNKKMLIFRLIVTEILKWGSEYYGAAEPPVRCGESHLSGLTEPLRSL